MNNHLASVDKLDVSGGDFSRVCKSRSARGHAMRPHAALSRSRWLQIESSMSFGRDWRTSPLSFSFEFLVGRALSGTVRIAGADRHAGNLTARRDELAAWTGHRRASKGEARWNPRARFLEHRRQRGSCDLLPISCRSPAGPSRCLLVVLDVAEDEAGRAFGFVAQRERA